MAEKKKGAKKPMARKAMKSTRGGLGAPTCNEVPYPSQAQGDEHANAHAELPPCPDPPGRS